VSSSIIIRITNFSWLIFYIIFSSFQHLNINFCYIYSLATRQIVYTKASPIQASSISKQLIQSFDHVHLRIFIRDLHVRTYLALLIKKITKNIFQNRDCLSKKNKIQAGIIFCIWPYMYIYKSNLYIYVCMYVCISLFFHLTFMCGTNYKPKMPW
jgi:hypothetical protein